MFFILVQISKEDKFRIMLITSSLFESPSIIKTSKDIFSQIDGKGLLTRFHVIFAVVMRGTLENIIKIRLFFVRPMLR